MFDLLDVIPFSALEFLVVCGMMFVFGLALGIVFEHERIRDDHN